MELSQDKEKINEHYEMIERDFGLTLKLLDIVDKSVNVIENVYNSTLPEDIKVFYYSQIQKIIEYNTAILTGELSSEEDASFNLISDEDEDELDIESLITLSQFIDKQYTASKLSELTNYLEIKDKEELLNVLYQKILLLLPEDYRIMIEKKKANAMNTVFSPKKQHLLEEALELLIKSD